MSYLNRFDEFAKLHSQPEDEVLAFVRRDTWVNVLYPQMLTNPLQGQLMQWISQWIVPHRILEIGTFTAYSAICLARGLHPDGLLTTIEINEELKERIVANIEKAGLSHSIELVFGNAIEILPNIHDQFDLIYIDADKKQYAQYLDLCLPLLKEGGVLMADNIWWDGKLLESKDKDDKETVGLRSFLQLCDTTKGIQRLMLPMADGLMMVKKIITEELD